MPPLWSEILLHDVVRAEPHGRRQRDVEGPGGLQVDRELDSLADVISFGVAPAALAYGAGMRGAWDVVVLVYFVCCGVSRLARFNVTAEEMSGASGKVTYFEGTPIPTSLLLVGLIAACAWLGRLGDDLPLGTIRLGVGRLHPLALLWALSGSLMISKTLHIPKL